MSNESLLVALLAFGWLALLAAAGAGPAVLLSAGLRDRLLLAPFFGLALLSSVLATASLVLPMDVAAFVVVLPAALVSTALAAILLRRERPRLDVREVALPLGVCAAALVVALAPAIIRGTTGPMTYTVADSWLNVSKSRWLSEHRVLDEVERGELPLRLPEYAGARRIRGHTRFAIPAVNASFSRLTGVAPDRTYLPLSAAIFALLPLSLWTTARALGAGRGTAGLAAAFAVSAVALVLVVDGGAENLAGLVLAPLAVTFFVDAIRRHTWVAFTRTGLVWAGLLAAYPEYGPPLVVAGALAATVVAGGRLAGGRFRPRDAYAAVTAVAGAGLVALAVSPYIVLRTAQYYRAATDYALDQGAARSLTLENVGALTFGVLHLYQLRDFALLSPAGTLLAVALPLALLSVALLGMVRGRDARLVLLAPAGTCVLLAAYLFGLRETREYPLWKWLLLATPFLVVGLALGLGRLGAAGRPGRRAAGLLAVVGLSTVAYTDLRFTRLLVKDAVGVPPQAHAVVDGAPELSPAQTVFLEGAEATEYPLVGYIGLYTALLELPGAQVSYDAGARGPGQQGDQLLLADPPFTRYERPDYGYVFSTFAGLGSARRITRRSGRFALSRRSGVDVLVTGVSSWAGEGRRTVPYATAPFQLWISSPRRGNVRLLVSTASPPTPSASLRFTLGGLALTATAAGGGAELCATVPVRGGFTIVDVRPLAAQQPAPRIGTWQTDVARVAGEPRIEQAPGIELRTILARPGVCEPKAGR